MILGYILGIWLVITIISSFINTKFFLCSYLAYFLLVPFMDLRFMGIPLGYNAVVSICLIGFLVKNKFTWKQLDFKPIIPFVTLYLLQLIMIPTQSGYSNAEMLNSWRVSAMGTLIAPFMIWNGYKKHPGLNRSLTLTLIICIIIICGYALLLTTMPGINPYLMFALPLGGKEFNEAYAMGQSGLATTVSSTVEGGRIFGRISSVFAHPMTFGIFACLSFIYLLYYLRFRKFKYLIYLALPVIALSAVSCGVRSSIGGIVIGVACYLLLTRKLKLAIYCIIGAYCVTMLAQYIPGMEEYLGSMTDIQGKNDAINGSSFDLRYKQFVGALNIIRNCPLEGMGVAWTEWYLSKFTIHPVCYCFESLIYIIICNNGIVGFFFWAIMLYMIVKKVKYSSNEQKTIVFTIVITYIGYACITGEYGYMKYMLIFYLFALMNSTEKNLANK